MNQNYFCISEFFTTEANTALCRYFTEEKKKVKIQVVGSDSEKAAFKIKKKKKKNL